MAQAVSLFLLFPTPLLAQTSSTTFTVSITVESDCLITANNLNFGAVDDLDQSIAGATNGFVTCSAIVPVSISFNAGTGGSSTFATRQMANGANTINYNIYRDSAHTEILGDGSGGTFTIDFTSTGGNDQFMVFGQTDPGQNPKPIGTYSSTITATITF
ncbi:MULTISPECIES: spore coat U domain-containing protein [unclassified Microbulbifer]|uniref:Csu type fimbrial protein n=1 Tax=unclassified Microbulbifer TaxID=2619833 RepID=UPI0027E3F2B2|nr:MULTISPECIES: spore coat U domain-containing protein [unclassified Microbulbifer]